MKEIIGEQFGDSSMRFDVVIGNPPYQEINGGGKNGSGGKALYDKFIELGLRLGSPYICMIVKNSWISNMEFTQLREQMLKAGLSRIINYPRIGEVFNGVSVTVSEFLINRKDTIGKIHYTIIDNNKVISDYKLDRNSIDNMIPANPVEAELMNLDVVDNTFAKHVLSAYPFGIKNNEVNIRGDRVETSYTKTSKFNTGIAFLDGNRKLECRYVSSNDISKNNEYVDTYKIICGLQLHKNASVITNIHGLMPGDICTGSYGVVFTSNNKDESLAALKYIKTRFVRMLVNLNIDIMSSVAPYRFEFVPDQDFTSSSDIDWSQSIADIDKQLYKKYNLSDEEIEYIEKTIKPMA